MKQADKYTIKAIEVIKPKSLSDWTNSEIIQVTQNSPKSYKKAVEQYACYFRREFDYDFVQFSANENPK